MQDGFLDIFTGKEPDLINTERTEAFIDIFQLTYVRVYLKDEVTAAEVTADGEKLNYNDDYKRWELVLRDYEEGDQLEIMVVSDKTRTQELSIIIREM